MWAKSFSDVHRFTIITSVTLVCIGIGGAAMAHFCALSVGVMGDGSVTYSVDNNETGAWTTTLAVSSPSAPWYSRLQINNGDYSGPVTMTWQLQQKTGNSNWGDFGRSVSTSIVLSGIPQNVYASSNGALTGNHDWGADISGSGTYRVVVTIELR